MFRVTLITADAPLADSVGPLIARAGLEFVALPAFDETAEPDPAAAPDVLCLDLRESRPPARSPFQDPWAKAFALGVVTPAQVPALDPALGLDDFITTPLQPARVRGAGAPNPLAARPRAGRQDAGRRRSGDGPDHLPDL